MIPNWTPQRVQIEVHTRTKETSSAEEEAKTESLCIVILKKQKERGTWGERYVQKRGRKLTTGDPNRTKENRREIERLLGGGGVDKI